jgi:hypothetical protein
MTPPSNPTPPPKPRFIGRARNGKVARLPEPARGRLNQMLLDNVPYQKVIQTFATKAPREGQTIRSGLSP